MKQKRTLLIILIVIIGLVAAYFAYKTGYSVGSSLAK